MDTSLNRNDLCHVGRGDICIWALCPTPNDHKDCPLEKLGPLFATQKSDD
jgi:hypothetical protein